MTDNTLRDITNLPGREALLDTSNRFSVSRQGSSIQVARAVAGRWLTRDDALNLAAWIVALADPDQYEWQAMLRGVLEQ